MQIKPAFLITCCTLFFFFSSHACAELSKKTAESLLKLSGLDKQVVEFPELIVTGIQQARQQGSPITEAVFQKVLSSARSSIVPAEILSEIHRHVTRSLDEKDAVELMQWYESDIGREISLAETHASSPVEYQKMLRNATALMKDEERVAIAERLDTLLGASKMSLDLQEFSGVAVFSGIMKALNPDQTVRIDQFKSQTAKQRERMKSQVHQLVILSLVYAFHTIEVDKLKRYEVFLKKAASQKFNRAVNEGMQYGLRDSVHKWSDALGVIFSEARLSSGSSNNI